MTRFHRILVYFTAVFFFAGFCAGFTVQWIHNSKIEELQREADLNKERRELYRALDQVMGDQE